MSFFLFSTQEVADKIAARAKAWRLSMNLSQKSLSARAKVSLGVIKQFEQTGKISLTSLLKLALIFGALETFEGVFQPPPATQYPSLDVLLKEKKRKRGRT